MRRFIEAAGHNNARKMWSFFKARTSLFMTRSFACSQFLLKRRYNLLPSLIISHHLSSSFVFFWISITLHLFIWRLLIHCDGGFPLRAGWEPSPPPLMMAIDGQCKIVKANANFSTKKANGGELKGGSLHISLLTCPMSASLRKLQKQIESD